MDDPAIKKEPTPEAKPKSVTEQPLITLYDLFGFTQEERSQTKRPKRRKNSKAKKEEVKELPFMDWREEMQYNAAKGTGKATTGDCRSLSGVRCTSGGTIRTTAEEAEREQQERMKPVPYHNAEDMPPHYREGSLVTDENNRIGYLRDLNGFQPMFHPLQLTGYTAGESIPLY
jgi:hypothetical protein